MNPERFEESFNVEGPSSMNGAPVAMPVDGMFGLLLKVLWLQGNSKSEEGPLSREGGESHRPNSRYFPFHGDNAIVPAREWTLLLFCTQNVTDNDGLLIFVVRLDTRTGPRDSVCKTPPNSFPFSTLPHCMELDETSKYPHADAIADIAYLVRSEHRILVLAKLSEEALDKTDLCELTEVSSSTIRRTLIEFQDRCWVRKEGREFTTTSLGAAIATQVDKLLGTVETERKLRDTWEFLPEEAIEFAIGSNSGTTVTVAEYDAPYRPVNRFRSLLEDAEEFRFVGVDIALLEPCREEFRRRVLDGMETEIINPPDAARYVFSTYPEITTDIVESGNILGLLHDDLPPYGVSIFDDRIAVNDYVPDRSGVTVLIDTDLSVAEEWAQSIYEKYRAEARPLNPETIRRQTL